MSTAIGENIHETRRRKGLTQDALAAAAGVTKKTISEWERGKATPHLGYLEKIAARLQVPVSDLTDNKLRVPPGMAQVSAPAAAPSASPTPQVMVPICGHVKAGPLRIVGQDSATDYMAADRGDANSYVLVVDGESMTPLYQNRDRVFVEPCDIRLEPLPRGVRMRIPLSHVERLHKKDCICLVDGESTFKRVLIEPHSDGIYTVTLNPINPDYDRVTVSPDTDFRVQGIVYKVIRYM